MSKIGFFKRYIVQRKEMNVYMRRRALIFGLLFVMVLSISVRAATTRSFMPEPDLLFNGTTAICSILVRASNASDKIEVEMKLWEGNKCIKTWSDNDTGKLSFEESITVRKGNFYTLTADVSINGIKFSTKSASGTCE